MVQCVNGRYCPVVVANVDDIAPPFARTIGGYRVRLRLIGEMGAWNLAGSSVLPRNRKTRALLAILALSPPGPVLRTRLAELLWSTRGSEQARMSLRQALHELGVVLATSGDPVIRATRHHLALRPGTVWVDAQEGVGVRPQAAVLDLLDGELLEDLRDLDPAFDSWRRAENERIRDRVRAVAEALVGSTDPAESQLAAERLLAMEPAHEPAWQVVIRRHVARGDRGLALAALERARAALAPVGGASPETEALAQLLRSGPAEPPPVPVQQEEEPRPPRRMVARGARVGVPPLRAIGGEPDDHFSIGLAEEITTALARFRWLPLVATGSLARLAEAGSDPAALRRDYGLDFLLDGTVQRAGGRVRITLRLLDLNADGEMVWAQRFDRAADDILTLQDEIAAEVVARVDPEILLIEARRAGSRPAASMGAYDLLLRAIPLMYRLEPAGFAEAGELLRAATDIEPDYAAPYAWYAYWHVFLIGQGWTGDSRQAMEHAAAAAERAVRLDPADARGLTIAGHVRAFMHRRLEEAVALHSRALTLNPNLPMAWMFSGVTLSYLGRHAEALGRMERYKCLSPLDPHAFFFDGMMMLPHLLTGAHDRAAEIGRQVTELQPGLSAAYKPYLAALGHLGALDEAAEARRRLLALEPCFTIRAYLDGSPLVRAEDREHFAAGLRLVGLPDG